MKRIIAIMLGLLLILTLCACLQRTPAEEENDKEQNIEQPADEEGIRTLGGVSLGDIRDSVISALGSKFTTVDEEDTGFLGEPYSKWTYDTGTMVIVGKDTKKLFHIETADPKLLTGLGIKVGDTYADVQNVYGKYPKAVSQQTNKELPGWYMLDNNQVVMFDFDLADNAIVNLQEPKPEDMVKMIRMTYWNLID